MISIRFATRQVADCVVWQIPRCIISIGPGAPVIMLAEEVRVAVGRNYATFARITGPPHVWQHAFYHAGSPYGTTCVIETINRSPLLMLGGFVVTNVQQVVTQEGLAELAQVAIIENVQAQFRKVI